MIEPADHSLFSESVVEVSAGKQSAAFELALAVVTSSKELQTESRLCIVLIMALHRIYPK